MRWLPIEQADKSKAQVVGWLGCREWTVGYEYGDGHWYSMAGLLKPQPNVFLEITSPTDNASAAQDDCPRFEIAVRGDQVSMRTHCGGASFEETERALRLAAKEIGAQIKSKGLCPAYSAAQDESVVTDAIAVLKRVAAEYADQIIAALRAAQTKEPTQKKDGGAVLINNDDIESIIGPELARRIPSAVDAAIEAALRAAQTKGTGK